MVKKRKKTYDERIVEALRTTWRKFSPERKAAYARQKVRGVAKGYICEMCSCLTTSAQCDHILRIGVRPGSRNATSDHDWNGYIDRLNSHRLQILCKTCHKLKTKYEEKT